MAAAPRKDIKNAPIRAKEPAEAVKQAVPAVAPKATDGGAPDVFERVAPATGATAAAAAAREAGAGRLEPKLTPPSAGQQGATEKSDAGATPAAAAKPAASAAADIREAAKGRVESTIKQDPDDPADGPREPRTDLAGIPAGIANLTGAGGKGVQTRTGASDEGAAAPAPFRDSGRAALTAQVDAVFPDADPTSSSGGVGAAVGGTGSVDMGRKGTPADLGMTGDSGRRGGGTSIGMDVFDTALPATGVVTASGELGILQGMLPASGADPNATPSVAKGDATLAAAIAHANTAEGQEEAAKNAGVTPPTAPPPAEPAAPTDDVPEQGFVSELFANGLTAAVTQLLQTYTTPPNQSEMEQLREVDDGLGRGLGKSDFLEAAGEQGIKNLETAVGSSLGGAKKGGKAGASQSVDPETAGHPELTEAYMAWRAAGRARLGLGTPLDGEGDVDPGREGTDTATSGSGPTDNMTVGMMDKAWREFLAGQPGEGRPAGGGRLDPSGGTRPGDMGNIDFGPDSTGAWTGETRTDEPEDALDSLNRPRLSVEDAKQDNSSDSEDDEEDKKHDEES